MPQISYSVPVNSVERGKEEIKRLLNEGIIEHSDSSYTAHIFYYKEKQ